MPTIVPAPSRGLRTVYLGRLGLAAVEDPITESLGSDVSTSGDATAVGERRAKGFSLTFDVHGLDDGTVAAGNTMRRQLRSLMQNHPLRLGGLYFSLSPDPERNGWLVIGAGELEDADGGVTFGSYKLALSQAFLVAQIRTHREGFRCDVTDLRLSTSPRDYLGQVMSTDFAALPNLPLFYLPPGSTDVAVLDSRVVTSAQQAGRDGSCLICPGRSNGDVVSWERPESAFNTGDVVVYDRRGQITAPAAGPDTLWEEVYGPDYQWNWLTAGQPQDTPVLDNGLVRVRWDGTNTPGFRVDVWNGAAYVEQGKMLVYRNGDIPAGFDDTWVSAGLTNDCTPDRTVVKVVLARAADSLSRETVYLTMQRGRRGVTFECYVSPMASGAAADAQLWWQPALNAGAADVVDARFRSETQTLPTPQGTGVLTPSPVGGSGATWATVSGGVPTVENFSALLRELTVVGTVAPYQAALVVVQGGNVDTSTGNSTQAYGAADGALIAYGQGNLGYLQAQLVFAPTQSDQVAQASTFRNAGSGTTSQVADATAFNGQAVKDTQPAQTNATLTKASNLIQGKYRIFARVRVDTAGATGSFQVKLGAVGSYIGTTTSTAYVNVDLGDVLATAANPTLAAYGWRSAGASGNVMIDRVWAVLVEDRTRPGAQYNGVRDQAQAALAMCLPQVRRPARAPV